MPRGRPKGSTNRKANPLRSPLRAASAPKFQCTREELEGAKELHKTSRISFLSWKDEISLDSKIEFVEEFRRKKNALQNAPNDVESSEQGSEESADHAQGQET